MKFKIGKDKEKTPTTQGMTMAQWMNKERMKPREFSHRGKFVNFIRVVPRSYIRWDLNERGKKAYHALTDDERRQLSLDLTRGGGHGEEDGKVSIYLSHDEYGGDDSSHKALQKIHDLLKKGDQRHKREDTRLSSYAEAQIS